MDESGERRPRVVAALDSGDASAALIGLGAELAARLGRELTAVFVEDENLLRLAGLPFAYEVDRAFALPRQLDASSLARALRHQAARLRGALARAAAHAGVSASLEVVQGRYLQSALAAAGAVDVLLVERPMTAPAHHARRSASAPGTRNGVAVLIDEHPDARHVLEFARGLARSRECELVVVLRAASREAARRLRADAQQGCYPGEPEPHYVAVVSDGAPAVAAALQLIRCGLLVGARARVARDVSWLGALIERLACPVLLLP